MTRLIGWSLVSILEPLTAGMSMSSPLRIRLFMLATRTQTDCFILQNCLCLYIEAWPSLHHHRLAWCEGKSRSKSPFNDQVFGFRYLSMGLWARSNPGREDWRRQIVARSLSGKAALCSPKQHGGGAEEIGKTCIERGCGLYWGNLPTCNEKDWGQISKELLGNAGEAVRSVSPCDMEWQGEGRHLEGMAGYHVVVKTAHPVFRLHVMLESTQSRSSRSLKPQPCSHWTFSRGKALRYAKTENTILTGALDLTRRTTGWRRNRDMWCWRRDCRPCLLWDPKPYAVGAWRAGETYW